VGGFTSNLVWRSAQALVNCVKFCDNWCRGFDQLGIPGRKYGQAPYTDHSSLTQGYASALIVSDKLLVLLNTTMIHYSPIIVYYEVLLIGEKRYFRSLQAEQTREE